jgi:hypothetical protein
MVGLRESCLLGRRIVLLSCWNMRVVLGMLVGVQK